MKNRTREICTSGTVRDEGGNILIYSANDGGIEETSASSEARSAPRSYPTEAILRELAHRESIARSPSHTSGDQGGRLDVSLWPNSDRGVWFPKKHVSGARLNATMSVGPSISSETLRIIRCREDTIRKETPCPPPIKRTCTVPAAAISPFAMRIMSIILITVI